MNRKSLKKSFMFVYVFAAVAVAVSVFVLQSRWREIDASRCSNVEIFCQGTWRKLPQVPPGASHRNLYPGTAGHASAIYLNSYVMKSGPWSSSVIQDADFAPAGTLVCVKPKVCTTVFSWCGLPWQNSRCPVRALVTVDQNLCHIATIITYSFRAHYPEMSPTSYAYSPFIPTSVWLLSNFVEQERYTYETMDQVVYFCSTDVCYRICLGNKLFIETRIYVSCMCKLAPVQTNNRQVPICVYESAGARGLFYYDFVIYWCESDSHWLLVSCSHEYGAARVCCQQGVVTHTPMKSSSQLRDSCTYYDKIKCVRLKVLLVKVEHELVCDTGYILLQCVFQYTLPKFNRTCDYVSYKPSCIEVDHVLEFERSLSLYRRCLYNHYFSG